MESEIAASLPKRKTRAIELGLGVRAPVDLVREPVFTEGSADDDVLVRPVGLHRDELAPPRAEAGEHDLRAARRPDRIVRELEGLPFRIRRWSVSLFRPLPSARMTWMLPPPSANPRRSPRSRRRSSPVGRPVGVGGVQAPPGEALQAGPVDPSPGGSPTCERSLNRVNAIELPSGENWGSRSS